MHNGARGSLYGAAASFDEGLRSDTTTVDAPIRIVLFAIWIKVNRIGEKRRERERERETLTDRDRHQCW